MIRPIPVLSLCAALAAASPAPAQTPDGESGMASQARRQIERFMDGIVARAERNGAEAAYAIDIGEGEEGAVTAVVRDIALSGPDFAWTIADMGIDLVPDGPDRYRATLRLPRSAALRDDEGAPLGGASLGGQRCVGFYVPSLDAWTEADCAFTDLSVWGEMSDEGASRFSIGSMAFRTTFREDRDGKWSGPVSMDVEDVRFGTNGEERVGLASADIDVAYGGWDFPLLSAVGAAPRGVLGGFFALSMSPDGALSAFTGGEGMRLGLELSPDGEDLEMKLSFKLSSDDETPETEPVPEWASLMESASATIALTDLRLSLAGLSGEVGFDSMNLGVGMDGLDTDAGSVFVEYGHAGLIAPLSGPDADFAPLALDLRLTLDGLPFLDVADLGADAYRDAFWDTTIRDLATLALERVLQAESAFEIERLSYESPALQVELAGWFAASATTPAMAVGTARLEVAGLSNLVERLGDMTAGDSDARDIVQALAIVQAMGRRIGEGAAARRVYDLELDPDGRLLLNGADMRPLVEGTMR